MKFLFASSLLFVTAVCSAAPTVVKTKKTPTGWVLLVNGSSFTVKGVGCNTAEGPNKEDYLKMAAEMGANSVRTWGMAPTSYFDRADKWGLTVDAGVWLNPVRASMADSYEDPAYRERLKTETLDYVKKLKNHRAVLFWTLGNEVFTFTESASEKKAFALFLDDLIRAVHKEDPNHPVIYAAASPEDLKYLKAYVPSVDVVGANTYGGYPWILRWLEREGFDRPVVATEFGPFGEWDRMKDENHQPYDPADFNKSKNYEDHWHTIEQTSARSLGGYAFVLGNFRNQGSLTWYNVNFGDKKRDAYWMLYRLYTGKEPPNRAPRIQLLKLDRASGLKPGQTISVSVKAGDPDGDELTYDYFVTDIASDPLIVQPPRYYPCDTDPKGLGRAVIHAPNEPGLYRVYGSVEDGHGNIAISDRSIRVEPLAR